MIDIQNSAKRTANDKDSLELRRRRIQRRKAPVEEIETTQKGLFIVSRHLVLHLFAVLAGKERASIGRGTREALAAKARGVKLGGWNAKSELAEREARERAQALRPIFATTGPAVGAEGC